MFFVENLNNIWNLYVLCSKRIGADPRIRHSIWSCLIGGAFNWLPNLCNQSAVQRICSMKSKQQAQWWVEEIVERILNILDRFKK